MSTKTPIKQTAKRERLIDTVEVAARYGISVRSVMPFVEQGRIPKPIQKRFGLGHQWKESVIDKDLEALE